MKIVKIIAVVLLVAFVGIQFVPTERNQSDVVPKTDFMLVNSVPDHIKSKLQTSCYDCHSNNTQYPWYNKVQPIAWFLEDHIKEGKAELNFNEWDSLSNRRKKSKLRSIIKQIENDEMPLDSYTLIHKDASFSEAEKQELIQWVGRLKDSI
ncbi:heme-binding protein [Winogradskyella epiphytica]|jgi:hypothetical protein|uniref:Heme-binding protein n=2 Tax=Flavobacteriaceae TaxID=49546 RepID=A0A2V4Y234_9FLAO|nr:MULTISPECIES: heme-binding domain-containing protein [Flavobacteriaceae]MDE1206298.1 heme-binding domain-containing protein [Tenacibaculum larymnensis]PYE82924.1 heme-binding protein [Winogradskyella epiphytica]GGW54581.1 heme-binding protein [Winogradskyella epiphytica]